MTTSEPTYLTTLEVARRLGMAVRSVQLMVDRGELEAWKTSGGHRRIHPRSVQDWVDAHQAPPPLSEPARASAATEAQAKAPTLPGVHGRVLLIEDSNHFQTLVALLLKQRFPRLDLSVADDGFDGLVQAGHLRPDLLLVDLVLPGIDGAALVFRLRQMPLFRQTRLIVVTALEGDELRPFEYALEGVPVVRKQRLVVDLPAAIDQALLDLSPDGQPAGLVGLPA